MSGEVAVGEVAEGVRTLLTAIKAGELTCSAAYRNRLEGAVVALDALSTPAGGADTGAPEHDA